jgi:hypothetical protein
MTKDHLFAAYGDHHDFLTHEEAIAATPEERIRSIWSFIVKLTKQFQSTLKPRDRVNFDAEDTMSELWIALRENDAEWNPERGRYITFAGTVIVRELCAIRDKARTVHSPRNSTCRMREYEEEEAEGTISARRRKTANDIRRTVGEIQQFTRERAEHGPEGGGAGPLERALRSESAGRVSDAVKTAIRECLTADEAAVVGRLAGLWGREAQSVWRVSFETGRDQDEVRKVRARAWRKIRDHLADIGHPAVTETD